MKFLLKLIRCKYFQDSANNIAVEKNTINWTVSHGKCKQRIQNAAVDRRFTDSMVQGDFKRLHKRVGQMTWQCRSYYFRKQKTGRDSAEFHLHTLTQQLLPAHFRLHRPSFSVAQPQTSLDKEFRLLAEELWHFRSVEDCCLLAQIE